MKKILVICLITIGLSEGWAQSLCHSSPVFYLEDGWEAFIHTVKAPTRWKTREYIILGVAAGGIGIAVSQDEAFQDWIIRNPGPVKDGLADVGEAMGNVYYVSGAMALSYGGACLFRQERFSEAVWVTTKSVIISALITHTLKNIINRQRPSEGQFPDADQWFEGRPFEKENKSFPSGHTTTAFAIASGLSHYYHDQWWVGAVAYPLAGLTAWSRMYHTKHWLSDVLAGAVIGTFTGKVVNTQENLRVSVLPSSFNGSLLLGLHYSF